MRAGRRRLPELFSLAIRMLTASSVSVIGFQDRGWKGGRWRRRGRQKSLEVQRVRHELRLGGWSVWGRAEGRGNGGARRFGCAPRGGRRS